jgi:hypothetical protein
MSLRKNNNNFPTLGRSGPSRNTAPRNTHPSVPTKSKKKGKLYSYLSNIPSPAFADIIKHLDLISLINLMSNARLKALVIDNIKSILPTLLHYTSVLSQSNRDANGHVTQLKSEIPAENFLFMGASGAVSGDMNLFVNNIPHPFTVYRLHLINQHKRELDIIAIYNLLIALRCLEVNYLSTIPFTEFELINIFKNVKNLERVAPLFDSIYRFWGKTTFGFQLYYVRVLVLYVINLSEEDYKKHIPLITTHISCILSRDLFRNDKWHLERDGIIGTLPMELSDLRHLNVEEDRFEINPDDIWANSATNTKLRDLHITKINGMITKQINCIVLKAEDFDKYDAIIRENIDKFTEVSGINIEFISKLFAKFKK